jgi:hypothetical protein
MREKSHKDGPLKLIHYSVSESPEWKNDGTYIAGPAPFLMVSFLKRQVEQCLSCLKFMKMRTGYITIS